MNGCFFFFIVLVSEAPKEAPVRKYLPSSVYLEEKTDEQKKEEVKLAMSAWTWIKDVGFSDIFFNDEYVYLCGPAAQRHGG